MTPDGRPRARLDQMLTEAEAARAIGDFALAESLLCEAAAADPGNKATKARMSLLAAHRKLADRDLSESAVDIENVVAAGANEPHVLEESSKLLTALGWSLAGRDTDGCLDHLGRAAELDPDNPSCHYLMTEIMAQAPEPPKMDVSVFAPGLRQEDLGRWIVISAMPKSGSTFLLSVLKTATGFTDRQFAFAGAQNEQELHLPAMRVWARDNIVVRQHFRATAANVMLLQSFGVRPVVQIRNIFDALVSMADMLKSFARTTVFAVDYSKFNRGTQLDYVATHWAPWYISFFVSLAIVERSGRLPVHWLSYEALLEDKLGVTRAMLDFCGVETPVERLAAAIAQIDSPERATSVRRNQARSGRGLEEFNNAQIIHIRGLTRFYPGINFSPIGL